MTSIVFPSFGSETAGWRPFSDSRFFRVAGALVCGLLGNDPGTVAAHGVWMMPHEATTTHPSSVLSGAAPLEEVTSLSAEIFQIRRLSGLTWEELATVFGVSRRSLHHWANGKPISAPNEERVRRVLAALRRIDRGEAQKNRALLLASFPGGGLLIDLLRRGDFEAIEHTVRAGPGRTWPATQLSVEAAAARRPPAPTKLVSARHDEGPVTRGRLSRVEMAPPRRGPG